MLLPKISQGDTDRTGGFCKQTKKKSANQAFTEHSKWSLVHWGPTHGMAQTVKCFIEKYSAEIWSCTTVVFGFVCIIKELHNQQEILG